ncbi:MAG: DUF1553 domain-containing protein [Planctomycetes bacterium]|nr:DUF1553 domain-containing protein [Planctomycetota bacterium]
MPVEDLLLSIALRSIRSPLFVAALALAAGTLALASAAPCGEAPPVPRYDRDVRPILADRCFKCHGPDEATRQAGLRLDTFEGASAEREGRAAVRPGRIEGSELWRRVTSHDEAVRMPPSASKKKPLGDDELELLRRWIEAGAEYEPHWSFVAPKRPEAPRVADANWMRSPIDRFLKAQLDAAGLAPNPREDDATLLRRVMLDLTGLAPTPEELDEFEADRREHKLERWIERIFSTEPYRSRYAERMATPWLDAARYADTSGIHMDAGRQIWPWRDWVLDAYRENMPFDRFVTEQLAGDLLPNATTAQKVASGFHRNHVTTDEGGAIDEEYKVEYAADRTGTTGSVFLGLTLGCARCHDHKFDPLSQADYYSLFAYFNSNEEPGLYSQQPNANRAFEPFLEVPTSEQHSERERLTQQLEGERAQLGERDPREADERAAFDAAIAQAGLDWTLPRVIDAQSQAGATLSVQADGSVLASGTNPDRDTFVLELASEARAQRLVLLEALGDPSLPHGRVGRAENGNAVLSAVVAQARSTKDPTQVQPLRFEWAWADHEQPNGDYRAVNVLDEDDELGWALDAHTREGPRALLLLADEPFGFEGGTQLVVRLEFESIYPRHTLGRVRVRTAAIGDELVARLPAASSGWYLCGPFPGERGALFERVDGPETAPLDLKQRFSGKAWSFEDERLDGKVNSLPSIAGNLYLAKRLFVPSTRELELSLGSDDGLRVYVDRAQVHAHQIDRAAGADQERAKASFARGRRDVVFKVVNTGGASGFYWRELPREGELAGELVATLLPKEARWPELEARVDKRWRTLFSPTYRAHSERIATLEGELEALGARVPRTMVMKELAMPRDTFVLMRGAYDKPDSQRRVERGVPRALGTLPAGAPKDRIGLAQWLLAPDNPLVARVAVNRLWELVFGTGIVATSEDFGVQGAFPSHPELLDWLAVEFRESGWDVQHVLRLLLTSEAYALSSRVRPDLAERDPENRLLARGARRRLHAEALRDNALHVGGLLVEHFGGPSVKPYQPEGLWQEVAMLGSNTRVYERGDGDALRRRSVYTYWKRACPPPAMLMLDAPTREFCNIRRLATNTPLQALVLWNDEQFVEAARGFAARTLAAGAGDDEAIAGAFRRATSRRPSGEELALLRSALADFRARYANSPSDAQALIEVGETPLPSGLDPSELAAWTLLCSSLLNLDATICRS